jgi:acetylornithine deacetylase/succinyl-diaminopimelate desuccinylase-like protein
VDATLSRLLADPDIRAARAHIESADAETVALQAALSEIPAPTGAEGPRGARVAELFRSAGLTEVRTDDVGNVRAWLGRPGAPAIVLAAHLDTVFSADVDVRVRKDGARLEGPGISDNARGLAALVTLARALTRARIAPTRPLLFVATVGEEGSGDLRGIKHLFNGSGAEHAAPLPRPYAMIALDGAGVDRIVHRGIGAARYRARYRGPGGHSWAAFGVANPASAVGRAASGVADLAADARRLPRSTAAVVRIGGGTGLNSIPQEAWLDLDVRSEDANALTRLDAAVRGALARAGEAENARRTAGTPPLTLEIEPLGQRPSGITPRTHPLVQAAIAANRALGLTHELAASSTDANVPMSLGVPAIALGAGGRAGDTHRTSEWYDNEQGPLGIVRALLVVAALAETDSQIT